MKRYDYKSFECAEDLIEWLNKNQHINVISVNHIDFADYKVFYYTEVDNT